MEKANRFEPKGRNWSVIFLLLISLVAVVGYSYTLLFTNGLDAEDSAERNARQDASQDAKREDYLEAREYYISEKVTGFDRLALEYGIHIDEVAMKELLIESDYLKGEESLFWLQVYGWVHSPEELANHIKQDYLDDGKSPMEEMQKWAARVEAYKAKGGRQ